MTSADVARRDPRPRRRLHADGEGFDHRAFGEADIVGQPVGKAAGWTTLSVRQPCTGGVAQKVTAGSTL